MKPGSYVEVKIKNGDVLKGIIMQAKDSKILSLKLDSGYNVSLDKKNILYVRELKQKIENKFSQQEEVKFNKNLKTIIILHTGGTVASRVSYKTGAVSPSFSPNEIINLFPELKDIANIRSRLIGNMFSEDMRFIHYNLIAKEIEKILNALS